MKGFFFRIVSILIIALISLMTIASCARGGKGAAGEPARVGDEENKSLVVWAYNSFLSEWGPGPPAAKAFQEKTGITITWVSHGSAGENLARLLQDGLRSGADVIVGIDQNMAGRVLDSSLLEPYRPKGAERIFPELILDNEFRLIPFDYSYFAVIYDSQKIGEELVPKNLEDLTGPAFRRSLILIDPRSSPVGLGFHRWVRNVYGSGCQDYWQRLEPNILTIASGWSSGYGLFTRGEAPLVLSYTTSPAYHLEYENSERFKAAIFAGGHPLQIEAAALLENAANKTNAQLFLDFMISEDFQKLIPLTQWMYPVIDITLPPSFRINPKSTVVLKAAPLSESELERELNEWAALMMKK